MAPVGHRLRQRLDTTATPLKLLGLDHRARRASVCWCVAPQRRGYRGAGVVQPLLPARHHLVKLWLLDDSQLSGAGEINPPPL
jgi:hypothetical protein